jgi:hypothetical protein
VDQYGENEIVRGIGCRPHLLVSVTFGIAVRNHGDVTAQCTFVKPCRHNT